MIDIRDVFKRLSQEDLFYGIQMRSLTYWDHPEADRVLAPGDRIWKNTVPSDNLEDMKDEE